LLLLRASAHAVDAAHVRHLADVQLSGLLVLVLAVAHGIVRVGTVGRPLHEFREGMQASLNSSKG
jgi:hypothetical protein